MSANTNIIEAVQRALENELLPALKAAESDTVDAGGEAIDIPQQAKARLKQKVNAAVVDIRLQLNSISV